ncbi:MAG: tRNA (N6-threonylcarbamoyladenosine(37)-N6)-methyltransferase TrmO [Clostridia bacterium]|nr:tRNA (N6-threonylcarbamoyladenosine(37)-N6)-methyltransferase TrmO [Clostridia bacterium]
MQIEMEIIATMKNKFTEKFGIPRQSGMIEETEGRIVFEGRYRNPDYVRGLEGFSHIWLLWIFSQNGQDNDASFSTTVRPPRLGGNRRVGVFATRSPFRPNMIGMSSVKLIKKKRSLSEGTVLVVSGADIMDGTPIIDIKPYIKFTDSHPDAVCGFADANALYRLEIECCDELLAKIDVDNRETVLKLLSCDPRPSYQNDPERIYIMDYNGYKIYFKADGGKATVTGISKTEDIK